MKENKPLMILVAGPYRSGTNDDPALIQKNVDAMNEMSLKLYKIWTSPCIGRVVCFAFDRNRWVKRNGRFDLERIISSSCY